MDCKKIQNILPSYVDNACGPGDTAVVEGHLATCNECRKFLSDLLDKPVDTKAVKAVVDNRLNESAAEDLPAAKVEPAAREEEVLPGDNIKRAGKLKRVSKEEALTPLEYFALALAIAVFAFIVYIFLKK